MSDRYKFGAYFKSQIWWKSEGRCWYCGCRLMPFTSMEPDSLEIDHVVPISAGGNNDFGNLVPSCRKCNSAKGDKDVERFREWLERDTPFWYELQKVGSVQ